jgi:hypothetical protein
VFDTRITLTINGKPKFMFCFKIYDYQKSNKLAQVIDAHIYARMHTRTHMLSLHMH